MMQRQTSRVRVFVVRLRWLRPCRCRTAGQPGSFCVVIDAALVGDRFTVQVRDAFDNPTPVTVDTGNMRDERTGAEVIPPSGGVVRFPADPRYQALVPDGAFPHPTLIQITPITMTGVGLDLADYPYLTEVDPDFFALSGAVKLDFEGTAQRNLDITVPAPADATTDDQYLALQHINFRNRDEMTLVDIASFDPANGMIVTGQASPFTLIIQQGVIGVVKALQCISFAKVVAFVGDLFNNGYLSAVFGPQLPFPLVAGVVNNLAVPVPCERPVQVQLKTFDDQPIATAACPGNSAAKGGFCPLPPLSDDTKPPLVESSSVSEGDTDADPLSPLSVTFDEPLTSATCELKDDDHAITVKGRCDVTANIVTFTPDIRLHYSTHYTFRVFEIVDMGQQPGDAVVTHFTTFTPRILQHIDMDARDVVWVDPVSLGRSACDDLIAVAEGDAQRQDFEGGIKIFDVTDLSQAPKLLGEHATAGVDRAVAFGTGAITTKSGPSGNTTPANHPGPFIMSVDGPGDPDRFGVWHLFELSSQDDSVSLNQVAVRFVNQSKPSYDAFREDPTSVLLGSGTKFIPNDLGVPVGVASFGSTASYIANTPFLGLQAIVLNDLNTDVLSGLQIDGQIPGLFRAVTTYRQHVLAVGQEGSDNKLVLADPQLHVTDTYTYAPSAGDRPVGVAGLGHWLSHPSLGSADQEDRDYAVVLPKGPGVGVIRTAIGATGMKFNPDEQLTLKTRGGRPSAAVGDPLTQMLFVADGTAGLTIIDLATPTEPRDDDQDGYDDRILGTFDLDGVRAQHVALFRDRIGRLVATVSAGSQGVYLVDVEPPRPLVEADTSPFVAHAVSPSQEPATEPCLSFELTAPTQDQEFAIDKPGPTMPSVELKVSISPPIANLLYQFELSDALGGHALDYQPDAPPGYAAPPVIRSPFVADPNWTVKFSNVDSAGDIYGGQVIKVKVTLKTSDGTLLPKTFTRRFFVIGHSLQKADIVGAVAGLSANEATCAENIARIETNFTQFDPGGASEATHDRYPMRSPIDASGRRGYGAFQLTKPVPNRLQIWNWRANLQGALDDHIRPAIQAAQAQLGQHPPYADEQVRHEAYAIYNGGSYYEFKNGAWMRQDYHCGLPCTDSDGNPNLRQGLPPGCNQESLTCVCKNRAVCYSDLAETPRPTPTPTSTPIPTDTPEPTGIPTP